ncbi:MAG: SDR family NAD(P)-dependent oxidoreductase [Chloroflexota bacterium]
MGQFDNKVVMITGAGGAIARGIVEKFAKEGAKLILVDRNKEAVQACVDELGDSINDYLITGGDLGKVEDMQAVIQASEDKFAQIDVLINTAGGYGGGSPVHETDISMLEKQFYLNTRITFIVLGQVAKHMVDEGVKGSLVTILAKTGLGGAKNTAAYAASKAAAHRIVQSMALELAEHDIRVNGIMPSTADTPANRESMPNADFSKWVTPEQIAETMAFLTSEASSAISGQAIGVYNKGLG